MQYDCILDWHKSAVIAVSGIRDPTDNAYAPKFGSWYPKFRLRSLYCQQRSFCVYMWNSGACSCFSFKNSSTGNYHSWVWSPLLFSWGLDANSTCVEIHRHALIFPLVAARLTHGSLPGRCLKTQVFFYASLQSAWGSQYSHDIVPNFHSWMVTTSMYCT